LEAYISFYLFSEGLFSPEALTLGWEGELGSWIGMKNGAGPPQAGQRTPITGKERGE